MARAACDLAENAATLESKADYLSLAGAWQDLALTLQSEMEDQKGNLAERRSPGMRKTRAEKP